MKRQFYRSTFYGIIVLLIFANCSCNGKKNTSKQKTNQEQVKTESQESPKFVTAFDISARTQLFVKELIDEIISKESTIYSFEPSDELIEKYSLRKQNEVYTISGFIKTTPTFTKSELESKGANFGKKDGEMMTISFPLSILQEFLAAENIMYFEISEPVTTK